MHSGKHQHWARVLHIATRAISLALQVPETSTPIDLEDDLSDVMAVLTQASQAFTLSGLCERPLESLLTSQHAGVCLALVAFVCVGKTADTEDNEDADKDIHELVLLVVPLQPVGVVIPELDTRYAAPWATIVESDVLDGGEFSRPATPGALVVHDRRPLGQALTNWLGCEQIARPRPVAARL